MATDPEAPPALVSTSDGITFAAAGGRIAFGPGRSSATVVPSSGAVDIETEVHDLGAGDGQIRGDRCRQDNQSW